MEWCISNGLLTRVHCHSSLVHHGDSTDRIVHKPCLLVAEELRGVRRVPHLLWNHWEASCGLSGLSDDVLERWNIYTWRFLTFLPFTGWPTFCKLFFNVLSKVIDRVVQGNLPPVKVRVAIVQVSVLLESFGADRVLQRAISSFSGKNWRFIYFWRYCTQVLRTYLVYRLILCLFLLFLLFLLLADFLDCQLVAFSSCWDRISLRFFLFIVKSRIDLILFAVFLIQHVYFIVVVY